MKTFKKAWDVVFGLRHFTARRMKANRDENSEEKKHTTEAFQGLWRTAFSRESMNK